VSDIEIIAAAITGAAGVIAAAIRWGVRRLAKSQDRGISTAPRGLPAVVPLDQHRGGRRDDTHG